MGAHSFLSFSSLASLVCDLYSFVGHAKLSGLVFVVLSVGALTRGPTLALNWLKSCEGWFRQFRLSGLSWSSPVGNVLFSLAILVK